MNKNTKLIKRLTVAATLSALAVVINIAFTHLIPSQFVGNPFFAIPLIIGSIILGPIYGGIMAVIADVGAFFIGGNPATFLPLMTVSRVFWGVIPWFIYRTKFKKLILFPGILITHLIVTTINTLALWLYIGRAVGATIPVRLLQLGPNVIVMYGICLIILIRVVDDSWLETLNVSFRKNVVQENQAISLE